MGKTDQGLNRPVPRLTAISEEAAQRNNVPDLSAGQINGNDHLRVELIGPGDEPLSSASLGQPLPDLAERLPR
jgi:hypothetical protein